jgi:2,4-dienoyl-CoA reductase (NADPH2)
VTLLSGEGEERQIPADMVIAAAPSRGNQELVAELEWSIDELHVCGDCVTPRGLTQAIHDGYRLGCRL